MVEWKAIWGSRDREWCGWCGRRCIEKKPVSSTLYGDDKASSRLFSLNCVAGE
jgi:hypothetical protein